MAPTRLILKETEGEVEVLLHYPGEPTAQSFGKTTAFANPLTLADLEELRFYLEDYLDLPTGHYAARGEKVHGEGLEAWGEALFGASFGTHAEWAQAYGIARAPPRGVSRSRF